MKYKYYIAPDGWDPFHPRTAAEYLDNNIARNKIRERYDRNRSRRLTTFVQRLLAVLVLFFVSALLVGATL